MPTAPHSGAAGTGPHSGAAGKGPHEGAAGTAPLLDVQGVSRHYGALRAVDDLSFQLGAGEVLGIGGPNGAGKTTLFDLISGLTPVSAGRIVLDGHDITRLRPDQTCHLGLARTFQLNAGFDALTAAENVYVAALFGQRARRFPGLTIARRTRQMAAEALARVGLGDRALAPVETMTVLERKLLMIAGAIVTEPKLLMMDEPVGGLTPDEIAQVQSVVATLAKEGLTILLIEHVMSFLMALSDRVLILHHGQKLYEGPPEGVGRDPDVIKVYLGERASRRLQGLFTGEGAQVAHG